MTPMGKAREGMQTKCATSWDCAYARPVENYQGLRSLVPPYKFALARPVRQRLYSEQRRAREAQADRRKVFTYSGKQQFYYMYLVWSNPCFIE